jgi:8-oxo-dGTP pyrophosphatase MutT (NUDIX family)
MLQFDPEREPVTPKDAATVAVVRETAAGLEVFCVQRHTRSGFLGGAVVFPGGKVDVADRGEHWRNLTTDLTARARSFAEDEPTARSFAVAALRELLEEAAILAVEGGELDAEQTAELRSELSRRAASETQAHAFAGLLRERGLKADTSRLEALAHWITPAAESRRYDTRFYILPLPGRQHGAHDRHETTASFWATPREVLGRWERGEIFLAPPTSRTLQILLPASDRPGAAAGARLPLLHAGRRSGGPRAAGRSAPSRARSRPGGPGRPDALRAAGRPFRRAPRGLSRRCARLNALRGRPGSH